MELRELADSLGIGDVPEGDWDRLEATLKAMALGREAGAIGGDGEPELMGIDEMNRLAERVVDASRQQAAEGAAADRITERLPYRAQSTTAQIAILNRLGQIHGAYQEPCSFSSGDLVTPVNKLNVNAVGEPHIVLEVFDPPIRGRSSPGTPFNGPRYDMRVLLYWRGEYMAYLAESWQYEPWTDPITNLVVDDDGEC